MRAVIFGAFISFFSFLPSIGAAEEYLDEMGCVAYDDTPICYKPSFLFDNEDPMFEHWVIERIQDEEVKFPDGSVGFLCTVTFHPVTEADAALGSLKEAVQQQVHHAGRWQPWMDFDIEIWDNGCQDTGVAI